MTKMAQVSHLMQTAAVSALDTAKAAYAVAFTTFETTFEAATAARGVAKEPLEAAKIAERVVLWSALALELEAGDGQFENNVATIAARKGVKDAALPMVRMRARDALTFKDLLSLVGASERAKKSPLTLAKVYKEERAASTARVEAQKDHIRGAYADAAKVMEISEDMLMALKDAGDSMATLAISAALNERMSSASFMADVYEMRARLAQATPEIRAAAGLILSGFDAA